MPFASRLAAPIAVLLLVVSSAFGAAPAQDPLRFIPDKTDFVVKIEHPRQLLESLNKLEVWKQAQRLDQVRQLLDSAQARRLFEFIAYYERDLGANWPELIDRIAGGGIAIGGKVVNAVDDPILGVMQGTDEAMMRKFVERAIGLVEEEMSRSESKDQLTRDRFKDFEVLHLGKGLHLSRIDAALLFANKVEALHSGIDQHLANSGKSDKPAKSILQSDALNKAKKALPPEPQLWAWYALDYLKSRPEAKNVLTTPRNDTVLTVLFAGILDVVRRADFLALGLYAKPDGFNLTIRMPAGRDGMAEDVELHLPRDPQKPGTLPPLQPKGVIFSHSFYFDLAAFWDTREKIMSPANAKMFEEGTKQAGRFLPGTTLEKLLAQSGVHHRFVVAAPGKIAYAVEPQVRLPAFGVVTTMRDPAFGKSVQLLIRGGAALASTQVKLLAFDEKYGDVPIFGYRFDEEGKLPNDPQNIRFNFTPTFCAVKDQVIAASSVELCKELIDIVQKEDRTKLVPQNMQSRLFARGGGAFLAAAPEALMTQMILSEAVTESEAKARVEQLLKFAEKLGALRLETDYSAREFRFDVDWRFDK